MVLKDDGVSIAYVHYNEIHHIIALSIQCLKLIVKIIIVVLMIIDHVCSL